MKKIITYILILTLAFTLVSCSDEKAEETDINLEALWREIEEDYGDKLSDMIILDIEGLETYYGLTETEVESFAGRVALEDNTAQEFLIIKAKEDMAETVRIAIEERAKALDKEWEGELSEQHELVKNYSLMQKGDYFFFAIHEEKDGAIKIFESKF